MNRKAVKGIAIAALVLMIVSVLLLVVQIGRLNMLPLKFFIPLVVVLVLIVAILAKFLLTQQGKYLKKQSNGGQIAAIVLSLILTIAALAGSMVIGKIHATMAAVTKGLKITAIVDVYVDKDDPAKTLKDAKDYTWAITSDYDMENTQKALDKIQKQEGFKPKTVEYASVPEMVDALYNGDVDAFLVNNAYVSVISELEGHKNFLDKTRLLYEFSIESEPPKSAKPAPNKKDDKGDKDEKDEKDEKADTLTMYLSGSDTRSNKVSSVSRSDVNIIASVNLETKEILLLNTPRDYYIPNPAYNGKLDKLTHCGLNGPQCSMDALSDLYDIDIDYYAQINFTGFETLIDALGGVTVESDTSFTTYGGTHIRKGSNDLNGKQALEFARERESLALGDIARGNHQMQVIKAALNKLTSTALIKNYSSILDSLQGMFVTDMPQSKISELVKMQLDDMSTWNIHSYAVTGSGDSKKTASIPNAYAYVMLPDEDMIRHAKELLQMVEDGKTLTEADINPA